MKIKDHMDEMENETSSSDYEEEVKGLGRIEKSFKTIFDQLTHGELSSKIETLLGLDIVHVS